MSKKPTYDESSIQSLDWKEHIRQRPGMYIGKLGNGKSYDDGISWGEAKEILFNSVNQELQPIRSKYEELSKNKDHINDLLSDGAKKARLIAKEKILEIREAVGLSKIL